MERVKGMMVFYCFSIDVTGLWTSPILPPFSPILNVCKAGGTKCQREKGDGENIDKFRIDIQPGEGIDEEFYIRGRHVEITQFHSYPVVPIRAKAITKSIPHPQNEPGESHHQENHQVGCSCFFPHPSKKGKYDDSGMKYKEEFVHEGIHVICSSI